jgi:hypothetical protein
MKTIKTRLGCALAILALLVPLSLSASVASREPLSIGVLAPASELVKGGLRGRAVTFSPTDFDAALGVHGVRAIEILSLPKPEEGKLMLGDKEVKVGERISRRELSSLTFTPAVPTLVESGFTFKAESVGLVESRCIIRFAEEMNYAPSVTHLTSALLSASTQTGLSASGRLTAYDPEGDSLTYLITEYPQHGALLLDDAETGSYRYLPIDGYAGEDSFSYVARDYYGNYSHEATVSLTVSPRASSHTYADMEEDEGYAAALLVESREIMQSELVGDTRFFHPSREVKLTDFLVMVMKAVGIRPLSRETFFENNDEIPSAQRGYIARAQREGYVIGELSDRGLVLDVDRIITRAEAAVIVSKILDSKKEPSALSVFADADAIPARAEAAVYTAYELGLLSLSEDGSIDATASLTRGDAAEMLANLIKHLS